MKKFAPYLLLLASFMSYIGLGITQMYTMIWLYEKTQSNFYLAMHACTLFGAGALGSLIYMSPLFKKNLLRTMIIAEVCMALCLSLLAVYTSLGSIYFLLSLLYILVSIYTPSAQALLHFLVGNKRIQSFNGLYYSMQSVGMALGWLLAPLLFPHISYRGLFFLDSVTSFISASLLLSLYFLPGVGKMSFDLSKSQKTKIKKRATSSLSLFFVFGVFASVSLIFAAINALEMGIFASIYQITNREIAYFFIAWTLASAFAAFVEKKRSLSLKSSLLFSAYALSILSVGLIFYIRLDINLFLYAICGFLYGMSNILCNLAIYQIGDPLQEAKYFNQKNLVSNLVMLSSLPLIGFFADHYSIVFSFSMTSCLALCGLSYLTIKSIPRRKEYG